MNIHFYQKKNNSIISFISAAQTLFMCATQALLMCATQSLFMCATLVCTALLCTSCEGTPHAKRQPVLNPQKTAPEIHSLIDESIGLLAAANGTHDTSLRIKAFHNIYRASVLAGQTGDTELIAFVEQTRKSAWIFCTLTLQTEPLPVAAGTPCSTPFTIRVTSDGQPADIPLSVIFSPVSAVDSSFVLPAPVSMQTEEHGILTIQPEQKEQPGLFPLIVRIDTGTYFLGAGFTAEMTAYAAADTAVPSISTSYKVHTTNRTVPSSICIMDFNQDGTPVHADKDITASALLFTLIAKKNFGAIGMSQFADAMENKDYDAAAAAAAEQFAGTVTRFICGTTRITGVTLSGKTWTAAATAELCIYDITSQRCELRTVTKAAASAPSPQAAVTAVRRRLGEVNLADILYYGL